MYLRDLLIGMGRRWYVTVVGLLLTGAAAWAVFGAVPITYTASLSVLLMPPEDTTAEIRNPYLNLEGMASARDVLTRRVDADVVRVPVEKAFPDGEYIVYSDMSTGGPMVVGEVRERTERGAMQLLERIRSELHSSIDIMQAEIGVPPVSRMTLTDVAIDQASEPDPRARYQWTLAVVGAGIVLTALLAGFIDGLVLSRRAKREARASDAAGIEEVEEQDAASGSPLAVGGRTEAATKASAGRALDRELTK
ncbi:hypothetical protein [Ruicaihuangia caeni]|uniref:hypothetical protein n=1 Tax=Ruicaihuangia caeni TaxID=3042517 RepID=UPI00338D9420